MSRTLEFWFRNKYNLAPTDPRFLACTVEQIQTEFWAHHYLANKGKGEEFEDYEFDAQAEFRRINEEAEAAEMAASAEKGKAPFVSSRVEPSTADEWETIIDHRQ